MLNRSARRDILELVIGYVLVLAAVWTPRPWSGVLFYVGLAWVALVTLLSGESVRCLGLTFEGLERSLWIVAGAAAMALIASLVAVRFDTLRSPLSNSAQGLHAWGYVLWAFVQQFLLQNYFLSRLLRILPSKMSAVAAAGVLFAIAHIPNPLLTAVTLIWGTVACLLFLRYRNLYTLGAAHAILGLCIAFTIPNAIHHQMHVGLGYLRYRQRPKPDQRSQSNQMVSTNEWVIAEAKSRYCALQARP